MKKLLCASRGGKAAAFMQAHVKRKKKAREKQDRKELRIYKRVNARLESLIANTKLLRRRASEDRQGMKLDREIVENEIIMYKLMNQSAKITSQTTDYVAWSASLGIAILRARDENNSFVADGLSSLLGEITRKHKEMMAEVDKLEARYHRLNEAQSLRWEEAKYYWRRSEERVLWEESQLKLDFDSCI